MAKDKGTVNPSNQGRPDLFIVRVQPVVLHSREAAVNGFQQPALPASMRNSTPQRRMHSGTKMTQLWRLFAPVRERQFAYLVAEEVREVLLFVVPIKWIRGIRLLFFLTLPVLISVSARLRWFCSAAFGFAVG